MPGHDIIVIGFSVVGFSALMVEALARPPNIHPRSEEVPAFPLVHEPIELATAERT